jgi:hypothetical protein
MMFVKEKSIRVQASPEQVFDYVSDILRHPEWARHKLTMRATGDGRYESTAVVSRVGHLEPRTQILIETKDRPRRFTFVCDDEFVGQYRWHFDIAPADGGALIRYGLERLQAPFWVKVVQPWLLWPMDGRQGVVIALANIKRALEAGIQPSRAPSVG